MDHFIIKQRQTSPYAWYIRQPETGMYLWKDLRLHIGTGYHSGFSDTYDVPGHFSTKIDGESCMEKYLSKENNMNYEVINNALYHGDNRWYVTDGNLYLWHNLEWRGITYDGSNDDGMSGYFASQELAQAHLDAFLEMGQFTIGRFNKYYVHKGDLHLFDSGILEDWYKVCKRSTKWANEHIYFDTKAEAEEALKNYLKNKYDIGENKMRPLKVGDKIVLQDYSYSYVLASAGVREHNYDESRMDTGIVLAVGCTLPTHNRWDSDMNNVIIRKDDGVIMFVMARFLKLAEPEIQELTVAEISKRLGYDVKVVKE